MIYAVPSVQFEGRSGYLPGGTYSQLAYPYKAQMSWSFITELLLHTSSLCTTEQHLYLSIYYYCLLHSYLVNVELLLFTVLTLFFIFFIFAPIILLYLSEYVLFMWPTWPRWLKTYTDMCKRSSLVHHKCLMLNVLKWVQVGWGGALIIPSKFPIFM